MDLRRSSLQQEWVYTTALEGYPAVHEADFRVGGTDSGRRFDKKFSREATYPWNAFHRNIHDRGTHANSYRGIDSYRKHGFDRPERFAGHDDADFAPYDNGYDYRHHICRRREDRHERDTDYGRSIYGSVCDKSSKRDGSRKRCDSRVRDKQSSCWERDQNPEHSLSRGHDVRQRSRSPRVLSQWKDNCDDRRNHEHFSVVPSATVRVKGLSSKATKEDLYQILAEWGPIRNVRVLKEKESSTCRGFAFVDFPSVVAARTMMEEVGYDGLVDDGRELSFDYSFKKTKSKKQVMHEKLSRKRRKLLQLARAAVAERVQQQQEEEEEEKEVVEGEVEDREAGEGEAEAEELLHGEGEELQQQQQQQQRQQVGELEIVEILHGPFSHGICASISCEELEERMDYIKEDPYLKVVIEDIEIGGPDVMMRYLSDPEVLQKLGHAMGFVVSEGIVNSTEHNAPDDDEYKTDRG
ncbi:hypothetical protein MKX01_010650 [Papaver californicum]|nr:hypothetical protein MKX01_010650 [Papaver californicum]